MQQVLTMVAGYFRWLADVLIPLLRGGGSVRRLVALIAALGPVLRVCWSGTGRARSAGGGPGSRREIKILFPDLV
jgi:hypothetical protein